MPVVRLLAATPPPRVNAWQTISRQLLTMWREFLQYLPQIVIAVVVLAITAGLARLATFMIRRVLGARLRTSLRDLIRQLAYILVWIVGILTASTVVFPTLTPGNLLATLGLTSIAIGFAFKDIFENFFAGILILWRFPLEIGDFVECENVRGRVEEITIRMTLVRQVDGQLVVLPNGFLFKNAVVVQTNRSYRRTSIVCGIAYDQDVDAARDVIHKAILGCKTVMKNHAIQVFAMEFGESSINFDVAWWTGSTPQQIRESRDEVVTNVKRALDEAGIEIPFPYRTLTFKEPLKLDRQSPSPTGSGSAGEASAGEA